MSAARSPTAAVAGEPANADSGKPPLHQYPTAAVCSRVLAHYGVDSKHHNALSWIADDIVVMAAGRFVLFVHLTTGVVDSQELPVNGGVGVVRVHPSRSCYVVGQRAVHKPGLVVCEWPSQKPVHTFEGGALVGFSAISFDVKGTRMATVADGPDYTLSVWDWETRSLILRNKCFGTDVHTVAFSTFDSSLLVSGGVGHIKFWTMANTFTGKKLQGTLGKFGRLEISDISGFAVLPDGKVISGSESGCLLLWEGDLVKCSFVASMDARSAHDESAAMGLCEYDFVPAHAGNISVVLLIHDGHTVVSCGADGYIRYWNREELDQAEGDGIPALYAPRCLLETHVGENTTIQSVTLCESRREWVVLDRSGAIVTVPFPTADEVRRGAIGPRAAEPVKLPFNGGGMLAAIPSPTEHIVFTGGEDGFVRAVNYIDGREQAKLRVFSAAVTSLTTLVPQEQPASSPLLLVAGGADGRVCVLEARSDQLLAHQEWRPHTDPVLTLCTDPQCRLLCSVSTKGMLFFFAVEQPSGALDPLGFCQSPIDDPLCAVWDSTVAGRASAGVLVGYQSGQVLHFACPVEGEVHRDVSFAFVPRYALVGIRQRKAPAPTPEDDKLNAVNVLDDDILEEPDNGPWPVVLLQALPGGEVAIGMDKAELVYAYTCKVRYGGRTSLPPLPPTGVEPEGYVEEPGRNLCYRDAVPCHAALSARQTELLLVCKHAQVIVRSLESDNDSQNKPKSGTQSPSVQLLAPSHDCTAGSVTSAHTSFDGSVFITTGSDGLVVSSLRVGCAAPASPPRPQRAATTTMPSAAALVSERSAPAADLSIQQQKEAHDAAKREAAQRARLELFLARLRDVQKEYETVLEQNAQLPTEARLAGADLELDADMARALDAEKARRVREARREFALDAAREQVRTQKLRRRFVDNLLCDRVVLHAFSRQFDVASFRTADPAAAIASLEADMAALQHSDDDDDGEDGQVRAVAGEKSERTCVDPKSQADAHGERAAAAETSAGTAAQAVHTAEDSVAQPPAATRSAKTGMSGMSASVKQQLEKQEQRQRERDARRRGYDALLSRKPDPSEDAKRLETQRAADLAARGECVFRTDPEYTSEPDFRPTATAKLQRMINLQRLLVSKKMAFNETVMTHRAEKQTIIEHVNVLRARIEVINAQLKDHRCDASKLALQPDECPERLFEMSRADLDAYAVQMTEEKARQEQAKQAQRGFGADLAGATRKESASSGTEGNTSVHSPRVSSQTADPRRSSVCPRGTLTQRGSSRTKSTRSVVERGSRGSMAFTGANRDRMDAELRSKLENIRPSELEEEDLSMARLALLAERDRLSNQAHQLMKEYDDKLQRLLEERMQLDGDVCFAEGHLLLLFREYQMLLLYRKRDKELRQQLVQVQRSRENARREIEGFKKEAAAHEAALARAQDKQKELKREAEAYIHAHGPTEKVPYLLKIFNRHIKRRKRDADDDDNDDVTSDEDEEDDVVDDIGEEVCPASCDAEVWAAVLHLRERRLDLVDTIADEKASNEALKRKADAGCATVASLSKEVDEGLKQIRLLEVEKRKELNRLDMVVPLRCDQVKCLKDNKCPFDLRAQPVIVIADEEMRRLRQRVYELADLKNTRRDACNSMQAEEQAVRAEKAEAREAHSEWESKVCDVMMLKFGQHVDLEMLESCGSSRRIECKKEQLRQLELRWERSLRQYEAKIADLRDKLQGKIIENTHLLQDYGSYEGERQDIDRALAQSTAKTVQRYRGARVATREDRANLRELIAAQQEEIDALTAEIMMLSRKGGHAYSPQMM